MGHYRLRIAFLALGVVLGYGSAFAHFSHWHDWHGHGHGYCHDYGFDRPGPGPTPQPGHDKSPKPIQ